MPKARAARCLRRGLDAAIRQGRLRFFEDELDAEEDGWFWLLALEPHEDGSLMQVVATQANGRGDTRNPYCMPIDGPVAVVASATPKEREGVDLPPPMVGPPSVFEANKASGDRQARREDAREDDDGNQDGGTEPT